MIILNIVLFSSFSVGKEHEIESEHPGISSDSVSQSPSNNGKEVIGDDGQVVLVHKEDTFGKMPNGVPRNVKVFVRNGSVINKSTGSGSTSISTINNHIRVMVDGKVFESDDTVGPYVITTDDNGNLIRRDMTPEDQIEMEQTIAANERWRQQFQQNMQQFQQNMQQQMSAMMNNMFGAQNMFGGQNNMFGAQNMFGAGGGNLFRRRNNIQIPGMNMFGR